MGCIVKQGLAIEMIAENLLAEPDGSLLVHLFQTRTRPGLRPTLDDECRGVFVELISMRPEPPPAGFLEDEVDRFWQ